MTRAELEAMPDRELDAVVAKNIFNWANVELYGQLGTTDSYWSGIDPTVNSHRPIPHCSTDDNAARLVRNRIAELKCVVEFSMELDRMVFNLPGIDPDMEVSSDPALLIKYLQATPREQCIAAILAVSARADGADRSGK